MWKLRFERSQGNAHTRRKTDQRNNVAKRERSRSISSRFSNFSNTKNPSSKFYKNPKMCVTLTCHDVMMEILFHGNGIA
jgi:hypothetical protein